MAVLMIVVMVVGMNLFPAMIVVEPEDLCPGLRPHDVDRAGQARVEGVDHPHHLNGLVHVLYRGADQGLLDGAQPAGVVPGGGVPAGGGDDLVAGDLAAFDLQPVAQGAPGRLGKPDGGGGVGHGGRDGNRAAGSELVHPGPAWPGPPSGSPQARAWCRSMTEMPAR